MVKNFTLNKLIQFIYGETNLIERLEIENAIEEDENLKKSYLDLYNGYKSYPKVKFFPRKSTIANILKYNENSALNATC